jgi:hypothetical protein
MDPFTFLKNNLPKKASILLQNLGSILGNNAVIYYLDKTTKTDKDTNDGLLGLFGLLDKVVPPEEHYDLNWILWATIFSIIYTLLLELEAKVYNQLTRKKRRSRKVKKGLKN